MRYDWDENKRAETLELHSVDFASNAPEIIIPTAEEDAIIDAGIAEDPDAFEVDDEWIANPKPSYEAVPHILERYRSARTRAQRTRRRAAARSRHRPAFRLTAVSASRRPPPPEPAATRRSR